MLNTLFKKQEETSASANVVDGKLILSLPEAENPVVWQMDLSSAKASALEVKKDEEKDIYTLILKTPRGENIDIAPFKSKKFAVEGLLAASKAMENAQGQIWQAPTGADAANVNYAPAYAQKKSGGKKWAIVIGSVLVLIILVNGATSLRPRPPASIQQASSTSTQQPAQQAAPVQSGVPMSADAFLQAQ
ncbi:MAG: hypothetical protein CBB87_05620 [Micavibrio sp. TMED27]|nr:hypothetical protein [Micavibrio sp.]OUT91500.1 MAG: hypothetical protein CBB87_05620 [Micavibrio sp. TMED27]|tara:strand:- start:1400 stop:1969 length:570 start_codon:yes stop_codon:yes gene_type:complete